MRTRPAPRHAARRGLHVTLTVRAWWLVAALVLVDTRTPRAVIV